MTPRTANGKVNWAAKQLGLLLLAFMLGGCSANVYAASDHPADRQLQSRMEIPARRCHGADAAKFDDSKWDDANLPHSFSMPYFAADRFYVGYGWYRKHFDVPKAWSGKRINLEFDGVFQVAEVFVNGKRIGEHKGGYTGFTFDITDAVKPATMSWPCA
jgi:hypothetical protein